MIAQKENHHKRAILSPKLTPKLSFILLKTNIDYIIEFDNYFTFLYLQNWEILQKFIGEENYLDTEHSPGLGLKTLCGHQDP